jgi:hypothetical protein
MTTVARLTAIGLLAVLVPHPASGQRPAQRRQQQMRVDSLTASIAGKVVTADTGSPIRGAEVRLATDGGYSRLATTNGDGRFELRDLPAGDYRLTVSRAGFITLMFGQRRPFESSRTIPLAEGANLETTMALQRGGVIAGRIFDQYGDPLAGTRVQVLRSRTVQGRRRLQSVGAPDLTDDTGAFRMYGLPPGEYYVATMVGLGDQVKRDPPAYYPGTANFAEAQAIRLGAGVEASADFQMPPIRNARVAGIVVNSAGLPVAANVSLTSDSVSIGPSLDGSAAAMSIHGDADPDGTFTLENVPPGPYTLSAMTQPNMDFMTSRNGQPAVADMVRRLPEAGSMSITVTGDDVTGMNLVLRRPAVLSGSFVADTGVTRPLPRGLRVDQRSIGGAPGMTMSMGVGGETGFQLVGLAGQFRVSVGGVPDGWTVKAMLLDGRDVADELIDLHGENATLRVVMSDRAASIVGTVQARNGDPVDHAVVVFPEDQSKWTFPSRFVKVVRADSRGQFRIPDLPGGERYFAAAVEYVEDGEQDDAEFLERLQRGATSFSLNDGEQKSLRLEPIPR